MLGDDETGVDGQDVRFDAGWLTGSQLTLWLSQRVGIRANMTYSDRPLVMEDASITEHVNLWTGTGDLLFRFRAPNETWEGREFLPYIALGVGGKWHNPAGDDFTCQDQEENKLWTCQPYTVPTTDPDGPMFALGEQKVLAGLVGVGGDLRFSPRFSLRLELSDRIYKPQTYAARFEGGSIYPLTNGDENVSKVVHEIGAQAGLQLLLGLREADVVAVAPAPPPPPPATPTPPPPATPTPPPPPRVEAFTVCVVDPTAPSGIRMQFATFLVASGDTVVVTGGQRVPLRSAVGDVMTAQQADWYVRGTPFRLTSGNYSAEFVTYGAQAVRQPSDLVYLGTVNGYPVYASSSDPALTPQIRQGFANVTDRDLAVVFRTNTNLRTGFDEIRTVYVPARAVGCTFQPLQRQEPVRKGGEENSGNN
jgi:hypothetical protein